MRHLEATDRLRHVAQGVRVAISVVPGVGLRADTDTVEGNKNNPARAHTVLSLTCACH